jgi:hypothetical protein
MLQTTINLLRPAEKESAQIITVKEEARRIIFIGFISSIGLGVIILIITVFLNASLQKSQSTNKSLKSQIQEYKQVESMLSVVKTRTSVIEKALEYSKPVDSQIANINKIASTPVFQGFTYDETEKFSVTFKPTSIEETLAMANTLISYSDEKLITTPRIESYGFDKDGMRLVFTFTPIWEKP